VDERLVAGEEPMPPSQQIAFQPALALMFTQHFHHTTIGRQMIVIRIGVRHPGAVSDLQHILPAVRVVFVRTEDPKIIGLHIELHHIAQKPTHDSCGLGLNSARARYLNGILMEVGQSKVLE
jgi:hypothetical protein